MRAHGRGVGLAMVLAGSALFIVNAGVSRVALRAGVDPLALTTVRVTGTFVALLAVAGVFRLEVLRPPTGRLGLLVLVHGLIGVAGLQWTYFVAIDRLPVGMALLLEYQAPILVALWARFVQREAVRRRMWLGLALAWGGLVAATGIWHGARFDLLGVAGGVGAAICFAVYFLVGEHGVGALDPLRVILWSFCVAAVGLNVLHPVTELPAHLLGDHVSLLGALQEYAVPVWLALCWVTVLGTVVPFALELFALRHLRATTVTMIAMLEPVGVSALGWAWFHESLGPVGVLGVVAVVSGIVIAQSARRVHLVVEPPHP